jgi:hypothetical protein
MYGLLNNAVDSSNYIALNHKTDELERMQKEAPVA